MNFPFSSFSELLGDARVRFTLLLLASFFLGSIPTGYLIGRLWGVDVRRTGSRNIGATNVQRSVGKFPALLTLAGDIAKGVAAVYLASFSIAWINEAPAVFGCAAIFGHCFSPFLGFQGGKGVAASLGVFAALAPAETLFAALVFAGVVAALRYVSLGSIAAAVCLPIFVAARSGTTPVFWAGAAAALLIIYRHRANIGRLLSGTENRLGARVH